MCRSAIAPLKLRTSVPMTRFARYTAVGAVATAVHYAILALAVEAGLLGAPSAAALGAWVGAQVAFAGNARFTFPGAPGGVRSWLRFQGTAVIGAAISFAVVAGGVAIGLHYLLAQPIATVVALAATYHVNRRWTFTTRPGRR
jgi:putative flippase GtrA